MWTFDNVGQFGSLMTGTFSHLESTGVYYQGILDSVSPTIDFLYNTVLLNPIFMGLIAVLLVLSLFTFGD